MPLQPSSTITLNDMGDLKRNDVRMRIQVSEPQAGIFTLNKSTLNGSDVLGSGFQWNIYEDELVEISQTDQVDVTTGIASRPIGALATVVASSNALDPNKNSNIHPNTRVLIEYQTTATAPTWTTLMQGYISQVETDYSYSGTAVVTLQLEDAMRRFMNAPLTSFTVNANESVLLGITGLISAGITASGIDDGVWSYSYNFTSLPSFGLTGAKTYTNTTVGEVLNDLLDAELGLIFIDKGSFKWIARNDAATTGWSGNTTQFDTFNVGYSPDFLFSQINASLMSAPTTIYSKDNTDVSSFFGTIVQTFSVNLQDANSLDAWMASVISYSPSIRLGTFSIPAFVPAKLNQLIYTVDDFNGKTSGLYQTFVNRTIFFDATSVSTQMQLFQPV